MHGMWPMTVLFLIVYIFLQHRSTYNGLTSIAKGGPFPWPGIERQAAKNDEHQDQWPGRKFCGHVTMSPKNRSWWVRCIHFWGQSGLLSCLSIKVELKSSNEKGDAWSTYVEVRCFKILLDVYPHNWGSSLENQTSQTSDAKSHLGSQNAVTKYHKTKCHLSAVQQREPKEMTLFLRMLSVFKQQLANS